MERVPSDAAAPAAQPQRKNRNDSLSIHKLNLRDYSFLLLSNWKWFVLSLAVCLGVAWLYIKCTPPTYERSASILIKSKDNNDNDAELIMQEIVTSRSLNLTNEVMNILIKAWESVARSHPGWKLDIYGTGRDKEMLQDMIEKSGLVDKVTLCGLSDDMPMVYASGSLFVLSSRFEGFGLVLLEAMTCGVPCVSFDCPEGPSEIISDGQDGILVPFRGLSDSQRTEVLAENICRMIEDRDMRIRMSQEAIAKAAAFSRDVIIDRWIELFKEITKK